MSEHMERFNRNIVRVDSLCELFERSKKSPRRPTVTEGDILRAAVVFLHSALENYLRSILTQWIPLKSDKKELDRISLAGREGRVEKFYLGELLQFSEIRISELISKSIEQHLSRVSFNSFQEICSWVKKIGVDKDGFAEGELIDNMIKRRHKIVHEADTNNAKGQGNHSATSINIKTVKAWESATVNFVKIIENQIDRWEQENGMPNL